MVEQSYKILNKDYKIAKELKKKQDGLINKIISIIRIDNNEWKKETVKKYKHLISILKNIIIITTMKITQKYLILVW